MLEMSNIYVFFIMITLLIMFYVTYVYFFQDKIMESLKLKGFGSRKQLREQQQLLRRHGYHCQSYLNRYPDLQKAFGKRCKNIKTWFKVRQHYLKYGIREGRNPRRPPAPPSTPVPPGTQQPVKTEPEPVSSLCKEQSIDTSRRLNEANTELRNARYKMESAFRNCSTLL